LSTKIGRYADGIIAAVMLTPVFFNIFSSRIFEPDKITLLRTLALVTLAAWTIKLIDQGGFKWEKASSDQGLLKSLINVPLIPVVVALVVVYTISTIFSVSPYTSLWGSYQRLQGTYTTFSYLVIFASLVVNLRRRSQVERLITVAIISSLSVSLYGILQRNGADPIPWGGDVTGRIAANMGNSIFVAAYLIMVFPLTIMRAVESFEAMLRDRGQLWPNFIRSTIYIFILALQAIAIYFSGSRGPWLGLGASLIVIWLGLSLVWRKRWLTISGVVLTLMAGTFLVLLNIPNGPLESLRDRPEFGRLGQLLDAESRTGRVRTLIWQGASQLMLHHAPLEFPDGHKDPYNIIRPLIGYGPESMYVAYNRFYPPELTQVEKRNASPDRSHNETWDSLVITGLFGLIVYLTLFGLLIYLGLKWLGLVPGKRERNLYLALYLLGGAISALIFVLTGGVKFFGVALPFGMVLGVAVYMILFSIFGHTQSSSSENDSLRAYIMVGLLAAIIAHFVEINFGIAIVATRTYFWVYAALLLLLGYLLPLRDVSFKRSFETNSELQKPINSYDETIHKRKSATSPSRRKPSSRRSTQRSLATGDLAWTRTAIIIGLLVGLLLVTLGFEFISSTSRQPSAISLVWSSLTQTTRAGGRSGILALMLTSWLVGVILLASESVEKEQNEIGQGNSVWLKIMAIAAVISIIIASVAWLWNAANLSELGRVSARTIEDVLGQVRNSENLLTTFYAQAFLIIFGLAGFLPIEWPQLKGRNYALGSALAVGLLGFAFLLSNYSNLRVIQADIAFKSGDQFARPDSWPVSIAIYNRANDLAPNEDYYYLFLGRAYLEYAKTLSDTQDRERLIEQASQDLKKAQEINPLNTDHTANLGRLYSLWATYSQDPNQRQERALTSEDYFAKSVILSPNNARLWDEWAVLYLNVLNEPENGLDKLQRALEIDPYYDWTYALLGDYYSHNLADQFNDQPEKKIEALNKAADYYANALKYGEGNAASQMLYNYAIALGGVNSQLSQIDQAILNYEKALQIQPDSAEVWRVQVALAQLYARQGDNSRALDYARAALSLSPQEQQEAIQTLIAQLGG
jgi:tetratricopeptide (TPR) repeat protein/O-antigen ligase